MDLSRVDETELLIPLYEGLLEEPRWDTFRSRLRRRTRADRVFITLTQADAPLPRLVDDQAVDAFSGLDPMRMAELRSGRVYAAEELVAPGLSPPRPLRVVRVRDPGGLALWLVVVREVGQFGAGEGALLGALAPHLTVAVRSYAALARERFSAETATGVLARAGIGWLTLDSDARVIEVAPALGTLLAAVTGRARLLGERLQPPLADAGRVLQQAAASYAADPERPPRIVRLTEAPSLDLLLRPITARSPGAAGNAVMLGVARTGLPANADEAVLLATLLGLSPGEARLALALARGRSIIEAGASLGLSQETARNYSKRIYAKTHSRGQAELVALVLSSVALLG